MLLLPPPATTVPEPPVAKNDRLLPALESTDSSPSPEPKTTACGDGIDVCFVSDGRIVMLLGSWTNKPVAPGGKGGGGPSVSTAGKMLPSCTPAVIAAASCCANAALAAVSKFKLTVCPCAPVTVTVGMSCSPKPGFGLLNGFFS